MAGDRPGIDALTRRPGPGSHRTTTTVGDRMVETLEDLPPVPDRLLFVGSSPTPESVAAGHYQQGPAGHAFWAALRASGVIPEETGDAEADDALTTAGHGMTDLVKTARPTSEAELRGAIGPLWQRIAIWRPAAVVFVDRAAASAAAGRPVTQHHGQLEGVALGGRPCFVMPDPSGTAEQTELGLRILRNLVSSLPRASTRR